MFTNDDLKKLGIHGSPVGGSLTAEVDLYNARKLLAYFNDPVKETAPFNSIQKVPLPSGITKQTHPNLVSAIRSSAIRSLVEYLEILVEIEKLMSLTQVKQPTQEQLSQIERMKNEYPDKVKRLHEAMEKIKSAIKEGNNNNPSEFKKKTPEGKWIDNGLLGYLDTIFPGFFAKTVGEVAQTDVGEEKDIEGTLEKLRGILSVLFVEAQKEQGKMLRTGNKLLVRDLSVQNGQVIDVEDMPEKLGDVVMDPDIVKLLNAYYAIVRVQPNSNSPPVLDVNALNSKQVEDLFKILGDIETNKNKIPKTLLEAHPLLNDEYRKIVREALEARLIALNMAEMKDTFVRMSEFAKKDAKQKEYAVAKIKSEADVKRLNEEAQNKFKRELAIYEKDDAEYARKKSEYDNKKADYDQKNREYNDYQAKKKKNRNDPSLGAEPERPVEPNRIGPAPTKPVEPVDMVFDPNALKPPARPFELEQLKPELKKLQDAMDILAGFVNYGKQKDTLKDKAKNKKRDVNNERDYVAAFSDVLDYFREVSNNYIKCDISVVGTAVDQMKGMQNALATAAHKNRENPDAQQLAELLRVDAYIEFTIQLIFLVAIGKEYFRSIDPNFNAKLNVFIKIAEMSRQALKEFMTKEQLKRFDEAAALLGDEVDQLVARFNKIKTDADHALDPLAPILQSETKLNLEKVNSANVGDYLDQAIGLLKVLALKRGVEHTSNETDKEGAGTLQQEYWDASKDFDVLKTQKITLNDRGRLEKAKEAALGGIAINETRLQEIIAALKRIKQEYEQGKHLQEAVANCITRIHKANQKVTTTPDGAFNAQALRENLASSELETARKIDNLKNHRDGVAKAQSEYTGAEDDLNKIIALIGEIKNPSENLLAARDKAKDELAKARENSRLVTGELTKIDNELLSQLLKRIRMNLLNAMKALAPEGATDQGDHVTIHSAEIVQNKSDDTLKTVGQIAPVIQTEVSGIMGAEREELDAFQGVPDSHNQIHELQQSVDGQVEEMATFVVNVQDVISKRFKVADEIKAAADARTRVGVNVLTAGMRLADAPGLNEGDPLNPDLQMGAFDDLMTAVEGLVTGNRNALNDINKLRNEYGQSTRVIIPACDAAQTQIEANESVVSESLEGIIKKLRLKALNATKALHDDPSPENTKKAEAIHGELEKAKKSFGRIPFRELDPVVSAAAAAIDTLGLAVVEATILSDAIVLIDQARTAGAVTNPENENNAGQVLKNDEVARSKGLMQDDSDEKLEALVAGGTNDFQEGQKLAGRVEDVIRRHEEGQSDRNYADHIQLGVQRGIQIAQEVLTSARAVQEERHAVIKEANERNEKVDTAAGKAEVQDALAEIHPVSGGKDQLTSAIERNNRKIQFLSAFVELAETEHEEVKKLRAPEGSNAADACNKANESIEANAKRAKAQIAKLMQEIRKDQDNLSAIAQEEEDLRIRKQGLSAELASVRNTINGLHQRLIESKVADIEFAYSGDILDSQLDDDELASIPTLVDGLNSQYAALSFRLGQIGTGIQLIPENDNDKQGMIFEHQNVDQLLTAKQTIAGAAKDHANGLQKRRKDIREKIAGIRLNDDLVHLSATDIQFDAQTSLVTLGRLLEVLRGHLESLQSRELNLNEIDPKKSNLITQEKSKALEQNKTYQVEIQEKILSLLHNIGAMAESAADAAPGVADPESLSDIDSTLQVLLGIKPLINPVTRLIPNGPAKGEPVVLAIDLLAQAVDDANKRISDETDRVNQLLQSHLAQIIEIEYNLKNGVITLQKAKENREKLAAERSNIKILPACQQALSEVTEADSKLGSTISTLDNLENQLRGLQDEFIPVFNGLRSIMVVMVDSNPSIEKDLPLTTEAAKEAQAMKKDDDRALEDMVTTATHVDTRTKALQGRLDAIKSGFEAGGFKLTKPDALGTAMEHGKAIADAVKKNANSVIAERNSLIHEARRIGVTGEAIIQGQHVVDALVIDSFDENADKEAIGALIKNTRAKLDILTAAQAECDAQIKALDKLSADNPDLPVNSTAALELLKIKQRLAGIRNTLQGAIEGHQAVLGIAEPHLAQLLTNEQRLLSFKSELDAGLDQIHELIKREQARVVAQGAIDVEHNHARTLDELERTHDEAMIVNLITVVSDVLSTFERQRAVLINGFINLINEEPGFPENEKKGYLAEVNRLVALIDAYKSMDSKARANADALKAKRLAVLEEIALIRQDDEVSQSSPELLSATELVNHDQLKSAPTETVVRQLESFAFALDKLTINNGIVAQIQPFASTQIEAAKSDYLSSNSRAVQTVLNVAGKLVSDLERRARSAEAETTSPMLTMQELEKLELHYQQLQQAIPVLKKFQDGNVAIGAINHLGEALKTARRRVESREQIIKLYDEIAAALMKPHQDIRDIGEGREHKNPLFNLPFVNEGPLNELERAKSAEEMKALDDQTLILAVSVAGKATAQYQRLSENMQKLKDAIAAYQNDYGMEINLGVVPLRSIEVLNLLKGRLERIAKDCKENAENELKRRADLKGKLHQAINQHAAALGEIVLPDHNVFPPTVITAYSVPGLKIPEFVHQMYEATSKLPVYASNAEASRATDSLSREYDHGESELESALLSASEAHNKHVMAMEVGLQNAVEAFEEHKMEFEGLERAYDSLVTVLKKNPALSDEDVEQHAKLGQRVLDSKVNATMVFEAVIQANQQLQQAIEDQRGEINFLTDQMNHYSIQKGRRYLVNHAEYQNNYATALARINRVFDRDPDPETDLSSLASQLLRFKNPLAYQSPTPRDAQTYNEEGVTESLRTAYLLKNEQLAAIQTVLKLAEVGLKKGEDEAVKAEARRNAIAQIDGLIGAMPTVVLDANQKGYLTKLRRQLEQIQLKNASDFVKELAALIDLARVAQVNAAEAAANPGLQSDSNLVNAGGVCREKAGVITREILAQGLEALRTKYEHQDVPDFDKQMADARVVITDCNRQVEVSGRNVVDEQERRLNLIAMMKGIVSEAKKNHGKDEVQAALTLSTHLPITFKDEKFIFGDTGHQLSAEQYTTRVSDLVSAIQATQAAIKRLERMYPQVPELSEDDAEAKGEYTAALNVLNAQLRKETKALGRLMAAQTALIQTHITALSNPSEDPAAMQTTAAQLIALTPSIFANPPEFVPGLMPTYQDLKAAVTSLAEALHANREVIIKQAFEFVRNEIARYRKNRFMGENEDGVVLDSIAFRNTSTDKDNLYGAYVHYTGLQYALDGTKHKNFSADYLKIIEKSPSLAAARACLDNMGAPAEDPRRAGIVGFEKQVTDTLKAVDAWVIIGQNVYAAISLANEMLADVNKRTVPALTEVINRINALILEVGPSIKRHEGTTHQLEALRKKRDELTAAALHLNEQIHQDALASTASFAPPAFTLTIPVVASPNTDFVQAMYLACQHASVARTSSAAMVIVDPIGNAFYESLEEFEASHNEIVKESEEQIQTLQQVLSSLAQEIDRLVEYNRLLESELERSKAETSSHPENFSALISQIDELQNKILVNRKTIHAKESQMRAIREQSVSDRATYDGYLEEYEEARSKIVMAQQYLSQFIRYEMLFAQVVGKVDPLVATEPTEAHVQKFTELLREIQSQFNAMSGKASPKPTDESTYNEHGVTDKLFLAYAMAIAQFTVLESLSRHAFTLLADLTCNDLQKLGNVKLAIKKALANDVEYRVSPTDPVAMGNSPLSDTQKDYLKKILAKVEDRIAVSRLLDDAILELPFDDFRAHYNAWKRYESLFASGDLSDTDALYIEKLRLHLLTVRHHGFYQQQVEALKDAQEYLPTINIPKTPVAAAPVAGLPDETGDDPDFDHFDDLFNAYHGVLVTQIPVVSAFLDAPIAFASDAEFREKFDRWTRVMTEISTLAVKLEESLDRTRDPGSSSPVDLFYAEALNEDEIRGRAAELNVLAVKLQEKLNQMGAAKKAKKDRQALNILHATSDLTKKSASEIARNNVDGLYALYERAFLPHIPGHPPMLTADEIKLAFDNLNGEYGIWAIKPPVGNYTLMFAEPIFNFISYDEGAFRAALEAALMRQLGNYLRSKESRGKEFKSDSSHPDASMDRYLKIYQLLQKFQTGATATVIKGDREALFVQSLAARKRTTDVKEAYYAAKVVGGWNSDDLPEHVQAQVVKARWDYEARKASGGAPPTVLSPDAMKDPFLIVHKLPDPDKLIPVKRELTKIYAPKDGGAGASGEKMNDNADLVALWGKATHCLIQEEGNYYLVTARENTDSGEVDFYMRDLGSDETAADAVATGLNVSDRQYKPTDLAIPAGKTHGVTITKHIADIIQDTLNRVALRETVDLRTDSPPKPRL